MVDLRIAAIAVTAIAGVIWEVSHKLKHRSNVKKLTEQLNHWVKKNPSDGRREAKKRIIASLENPTGSTHSKIDLSYLDLDELPDCMTLLPYIESIDCTGNQLTGLPPSIKELHNLKTVILNNNPKLSAIPDCLMENANIESLNIANCAIEQIPSKIQNMHNLQKILCHHNKLSNIAEEIGQLKKLHTLSLYGNTMLKSLPSSLHNLRGLKDLTADLSLTQHDQALFETTEKRYKAYLDDHLPYKQTHTELITTIGQDDSDLQNFLKTQSTFMAFVFKLQNTKVWINQRGDTIESIHEIAKKMQSDPSFRDECHIMATQSTESCEDRMIFYYLLMNLNKSQPTLTLESDFNDVFKSAKSTAMVMHTVHAAKENAIESNQPDEEIEYCLAYLDHIKQALGVKIPQMAYRHHIKINQERMHANKNDLEKMSELTAYELMRDDPSYRRINCIKTLLAEVSAQKEFDTTNIDAQHDSDYLEKISQLKHAVEKKQLETLRDAKQFGYPETLQSLQDQQRSNQKKGKMSSLLKSTDLKKKPNPIFRFFRWLATYSTHKNMDHNNPNSRQHTPKNN